MLFWIIFWNLDLPRSRSTPLIYVERWAANVLKQLLIFVILIRQLISSWSWFREENWWSLSSQQRLSNECESGGNLCSHLLFTPSSILFSPGVVDGHAQSFWRFDLFFWIIRNEKREPNARGYISGCMAERIFIQRQRDGPIRFMTRIGRPDSALSRASRPSVTNNCD